VSVGKTTVICHLVGLTADRKKKKPTKNEKRPHSALNYATEWNSGVALGAPSGYTREQFCGVVAAEFLFC